MPGPKTWVFGPGRFYPLDNALLILKAIGFLYKWVSGADLQNYEWTFDDGSFAKLNEWGGTDGTIAYNEEEGNTIRIRLYQGEGWQPTYYGQITSLADTVDGYVFEDTQVDGNTTTLKLRKGFPAEYQVKVTIDSSVTAADLEGLKLYAEAVHATSGTDKYEGDLPSSSTTLVLYDPERDPASTWDENPGGAFSGNETTRAYVKDADGNRIPSGTVYNGLLINYPKKTVAEDDATEETQYTDYVSISKVDFESAIGPYDVLGEGAEYGVIADTYIRKDHTETNFAVNHYTEDTSAGIDLAANSGESEAMPFYVGDYNKIHFTNKTTVNPDIYTPSTKDSPYVHTSEDEATDKIHTDSYQYDVTVIPTSPEDVSSYVTGLINKLTESSSTYRDKPSIVPESTQSVAVDTTSLPDNTTIYIDASSINLAQTGWRIKKLEGQTLVFNIPGEDVTISKEVVDVYTKGDDGKLVTVIEGLDSNTSGNGGDQNHNNNVENHILNHIVFNAYEAENVEFVSGPAGLFLAPNADFEETSGSGTGWVATGKTFTQTSAEWHFFRTQRKYKAEGDFSLSGEKKIMEGDNEKDYSEFSSMTFTFELCKCDENGNVEEDVDALETVTADSDGNFAFKKLKYTQADVPEGESKTFYYVIKEVVPSEENDKGVVYDADPVYVKVVATDESGSEEITFAISKKSGQSESWTEITPTGDNSNVYAIGDFANTLENGSLKVKKVVNGDNAKNDQYEIAVKNSEGHYFDVNGTDKGTDAFYVTFAKNQEQTWANLPAGTYTVEEKDASVDGYSLTVSGTGNVDVTAGEEATADVSNTYVKHAEAEIKAKKTFTGREWKDTDSFSFILTPVEGAPMPSDAVTVDGVKVKKITVSSSAEASFGTIVYSVAGTYTYSISEEIPEDADKLKGVTYDEESHIVTVKVSPGTDGNLSATVTYETEDASSQEITNTYDATGSATFTGAKTLTGREFKQGDSFTFTVSTDSADAPLPNPNTVTINPTSGTTAEFTFEEVGYGLDDVGKTYVYTVTESGSGDGITNDTGEHTVIVTIDDNGDGTLAVTPVYNDGTALAFVNTYAATGEAEILVKKNFTGRAWKEGDSFDFILAPADGAPMPADVAADGTKTITVTSDTAASFGAISFTATGEYSYTVTEVEPAEADKIKGVTYDTTAHAVTINVTDPNKNGNLVTEVVYEDETKAFVDAGNTYDAEGTTTLGGTKVLENRKLKSTDSWTYTLEPVDGAPIRKSKGGETQSKLTASNAGSSTFTFGTLYYQLSDLDGVQADADGKRTKTFSYTVTESGTVAGVTNDAQNPKTVEVTVTDDGTGALTVTQFPNNSAASFTNTYSTKGKITFSGTKTLENRKLTAGEFSFELYDSEGTLLETVTNAEDGSYEFTKISYTGDDLGKDADGNYNATATKSYKVVEKAGDDASVTYDETKYEVTVILTDDGAGTIDAVADPEADTYDFTNAYSTKGEITFSGTKTLENRKLTAGEFSFELYDGEGNLLQTATNAADGSYSFEKIEYTGADLDKDDDGYYVETTKKYKVVEKAGELGGVTYDTTEYEVTVTLTDDGKGTITATATPEADTYDFTNAYDATASFEITGLTKVLKNGTLKAKQFSFQLKDADGKVIQTTTNDASGNIAFAAISYKLSDLEGAASKKFSYTVTEVIPSGAKKNSDGTYTSGGITYSGDEVAIEVTVSDNGDGTLKISGAEDGKFNAKHTFTNTQEQKKKKKEKLAKTSDLANPGMVAGILGAGLAVIGCGIYIRRRRKK